MAAFKATLEELEDADLLLHVIDASNPRYEQQMVSVEQILADLDLTGKQRVYVFNKIDRIEKEEAEYLAIRFDAVTVSARDRRTLPPLLGAVEQHIFERVKSDVRP